jgi:hypothetical protein
MRRGTSETGFFDSQNVEDNLLRPALKRAQHPGSATRVLEGTQVDTTARV